MTLWEQYLKSEKLPSLNKNVETETLIIGGGLAGLSTLDFLNNDKAILVEANQVGQGVTKGTTGKITFLQEDLLSKLLKKDFSKAQNYLKSQKDAISLIKKKIDKEKINCHFEKSASLLITNKEKEIEKIKQVAKLLKLENIKTEEIIKKDFYALKVSDTYVFNPLEFINFLKKKWMQKIYENTKIVDVVYKDGFYYAQTSENKIIKCQNVVIACHYPFFLKPLFLPLNTTIEKSYIIVKEEKENKHYNFITFKKPVLSFRYYEDNNKVYGIYLSKSHNTCYQSNDSKKFKEVQEIFKIKDEDILFKWTNMDIKTNDYLPYIGKIKNNLYIATGFNTWGMTNSIFGGKIISDLIKGQKNPYLKLFNPKRKSKYYRCYYSIYSNILSFIKGLKKNKSWYQDKVIVKNIKGKRIGIYIKNGQKYEVVATCPHLKCPLEFNNVDKTWDCPCHGSRFSYDGKCVKGPSKYNIKL